MYRYDVILKNNLFKIRTYTQTKENKPYQLINSEGVMVNSGIWTPQEYLTKRFKGVRIIFKKITLDCYNDTNLDCTVVLASYLPPEEAERLIKNRVTKLIKEERNRLNWRITNNALTLLLQLNYKEEEK